MKITVTRRIQEQGGAILVYFIMMCIFASAIAGVAVYVSQTTGLAKRRGDMISAEQYAESGAVIAGDDLRKAYAASNGFPASLTSFLYTLDSSLSTPQQQVYTRTISAPFTNQTVAAQVWVPNIPLPQTAKVVTTTTVGDVNQTATLNVNLGFAYPAAIISVNDGTTDTSVAKSSAQHGNVVVNGAGSGPLVVDGNVGLAIMANGRANIDTTNHATVSLAAVSMTNANTANEIPNLTGLGIDALFDFNRFMAVANATTNSYNTNSHNNHFNNVYNFANAMKLAPNHTIEGVVTVDINTLVDLDTTMFPFGINVKGSLFFNFGPQFGILDKFVIKDAALNINAADLSSMVATNPATYPNGYPPAYADQTKNPTNINIAAQGFANISPIEDLPALMYNIGEVDIHGPINISGVCYTPSYMEIENKQNNQTQYIKGTLIMGNGIYYENNDQSTSIISFNKVAIDNLATLNNRGKTVKVAFWQ